jgi:hypothetical protein
MPSKSIFCARGNFYESQFNPLIKGGMFVLSPVLLSPVNPVLIQSAVVDRKDIYSAKAYLNNEKLFFSFGQAWGTIKISGEILLGPTDFLEGNQGGVVNAVTQSVANGLRVVETYFDTFRASVYQRPIILSSLRYAKPVKFFLTTYQRGRVNINFNTVGFSFGGVIIDTNKGFIQDAFDQVVGAGAAGVSEGISGAVGGIL